MNYFELYPGDYLRDTTRLTLIDHGAYLRLMMAYYGEEQPLPADVAELFVIVAAISPADKAAVRKVADRYFPIGADGLRRNKRADEEILKAQKRIAQARENGSKGGRKPKPSENPAGNPPGNPAGSKTPGSENPERTQPATQRGTRSGEALHTPHATRHAEAKAGSAHAVDPNLATTDAGRACLLMREAGCVSTNPSHPGLLAALKAGVTPEALGHTAREAIDSGKSKPFAWAITAAHGRLTEGATTTNGATHAPGTRAGRASLADQSAAGNAERAARRSEPAGDASPIDSTATRLPS